MYRTDNIGMRGSFPSVKLYVVKVSESQQHVNFPRGTVKPGGRGQKLVSASHHRVLWCRVFIILTP